MSEIVKFLSQFRFSVSLHSTGHIFVVDLSNTFGRVVIIN